MLDCRSPFGVSVRLLENVILAAYVHDAILQVKLPFVTRSSYLQAMHEKNEQIDKWSARPSPNRRESSELAETVYKPCHTDKPPHCPYRISHFDSLLQRHRRRCRVALLRRRCPLLPLHSPGGFESRQGEKDSKMLSIVRFSPSKSPNLHSTTKLSSSSSSLSDLSSLISLTSSSEVSSMPSTCCCTIGPTVLRMAAFMCCWSIVRATKRVDQQKKKPSNIFEMLRRSGKVQHNGLDRVPVGGRDMTDWMIFVWVSTLCNRFSCNAIAGTCISSTRGSPFGKAGSLQFKANNTINNTWQTVPSTEATSGGHHLRDLNGNFFVGVHGNRSARRCGLICGRL